MNKIQTLDEVINHFEDELKKNPITIETFRDWQATPTTQRLYMDASRAVLESMMDNDVVFESVEQVALRQAYARGLQDALKMIVDWQPGEYL